MHTKNEIVTLTIQDMTHEGMGVGHTEDGMAVLVPRTAVGDELQVRLVKVNRRFAYGRIEQILSPSLHRIEPDCPVSHRCGGCVFRHVSYAAELQYKERFVQENLRRLGGWQGQVEPILPSPKVDGYRNKAQYPIRLQRGQVTAGFFAPRSHEVVDCRNCRLQPKDFGEILEQVLEFAEEAGLVPYQEEAGTGDLRHVYLRCGEQTGERMVCLVVNGTCLPHAQALVERLTRFDPRIVSIQVNFNTKNTNVILGPHTQVLYGKGTIMDRLCGLEFDLSPHAFYQVNNMAAQMLYQLAAQYAQLSGKETLLDLYCGAGTIGLSMANQCARVIGVEIIPQAVENAKINAKRNGVENAEFYCGDAAQAALMLQEQQIRPDVVILDPPRKGCEDTLLETIVEMAPERIVYISCNSATLARDCKRLTELGYQLERCRPVDLFPRTSHVEAVVLLSKKEGREG